MTENKKEESFGSFVERTGKALTGIDTNTPDAAVDESLFDDGMDIALRYDIIKKHLSITEKSELDGITTLFDYHNAMIEYAALRTAPMQAEIDRLTSALTDAESKAAVWVDDKQIEREAKRLYPYDSGNDARAANNARRRIIFDKACKWLRSQTFQNEKGE